jgi:hypothetical protein
MAYTTINKSGDYFNTKLISGNGGTQSLTGVGFKPDFTWIKSRSRVDPHSITDIVRGVASQLDSSLNSAPTTHSDAITSFNSDGFSLGSQADVNRSGTTFASWNWLAGGSQGSSNTDGSINTTYTSVNTTAGFSISQYTGTGSNATVGHGLGVAPKMIIVKCISQTDAWGVYHSSVGAGKYLKLNETSAESTATTVFPTAQTSSIFYLGDSGLVNGSGRTYIAYCFADVTGYSKFGSYVGNSDTNGTFVYTGFKPAFVMIKNTTNANNWFIIDNKRALFNLADDSLFPNSNSAEMTTQPTNYGLDILSNGMKMRTSGSHTANNNNSSSNTYIYMAFAEAPLVGSNNVPCTAR